MHYVSTSWCKKKESLLPPWGDRTSMKITDSNTRERVDAGNIAAYWVKSIHVMTPPGSKPKPDGVGVGRIP
jgi:hypothetical protein